MLIGPNTVVSIHYRLTNSAGEQIDASSEGSPMTYLHGAGNIIPGLERELAGKESGATLEVTVQPEDGYGERQSQLMQEVPRGAFPEGQEIEPGMRFSAQTEGGPVAVVVTDVTPEAVTVDANHPLAGEVLHFSVSVADVREATAEEISHGHVHGPEGHAH